MRAFFAPIALVALIGCSQQPETDAEPTAAAEPAATTPTTPAFDTAAWVREANPDMGPLMYRDGHADLNGDGIDEIFVFTGGAMVCGSGGCPLTVLDVSGAEPATVLETTVTQLPVGVLDTSTEGWRDIWVTTYGGGEPQRIRKLAGYKAVGKVNPTGSEIEVLDQPGTVVIEEGELTRLD